MADTPLIITLRLGNTTFTVEGVLKCCSKDIIELVQAATPQAGTQGESQGRPIGEAEMIRAKQPANHSETVAVLAFCLAESGLNEFTPDDIKRGYIRAGVRPPKVIDQAIRDARNAHDYIAPGSRKGTYRLSDHGERVVRFDLPRKD